jgi:hypothetical protein
LKVVAALFSSLQEEGWKPLNEPGGTLLRWFENLEA